MIFFDQVNLLVKNPLGEPSHIAIFWGAQLHYLSYVFLHFCQRLLADTPNRICKRENSVFYPPGVFPV